MSRRMRKLFLSGVVGGIMATSALGGTVMAAVSGQVQIFQPSTGWAVSRIASDSGKAPFCAMARKFSDNVILTFARNAKNEVSIAVDFQRDALDTSQTYFTVLKPGYSQDRAFNVHPVSSKAMVVRMGSDKDFMEALLRSERLNMDVDGDQYSFAIPGLTGGLHDVEECLSSIVEPPSPTQVEPSQQANAEDPQPDPAVQNLRVENEKLKNDLDRSRKSFQDTVGAQASASGAVTELNAKVLLLEAQNDDLRRQVALATAAKVAPDAQLAALRTENSELKQKIVAADSKAQAQLATLTGENVSLKQKLSTPDPALQQQIASLQDENTRLKTKAETPDPSIKAELASLATENGQLKQELTSLRDHVTTMASIPPAVEGKDQATIARLTARIDTLQSENTSLSQTLTKIKADGVNDGKIVTLAQVRSAEAQLAAVTADRDRLARQIDDYRTGNEDKLLKMAGNNWDLQQATQRYTEAQREIERLGHQIENDRAKYEKDKKEIEYTLFDPRIASQEQIAKLTEAENNLKKSKDALAKRDAELAALNKDYDQKIANLKKDADTKQAQLASAQNEMEMMRKQYETRLASASADKSQLNDIKSKLAAKEHEIGVMTAQSLAASADLNKQQSDARHALAEKDKQLGSARAAVNTMEDKADAQRKKAQASLSSGQGAMGPQRPPAKDGATAASEVAAIGPAAGPSDVSATPSALGAPEPLEKAETVGGNPVTVAQAPATPRPETVQIAWRQQDRQVSVSQPDPSEAQKMETVERVPLALPPPSSLKVLPAPESSALAAISPDNAAAPARSIPVVSDPDSLLSQKADVKFIGPSELQGMLSGAGVKLSKDVQKVSKASGPQSLALTWETGALFGSAEEKVLDNSKQFDAYVQDYIDKTKGRCDGEFAAVPGAKKNEGDVQSSGYEIACISGNGKGASAALLFYARDGVFTAFAHEAGVDGMEQAMDVRDRLASSLHSSKLASR